MQTIKLTADPLLSLSDLAQVLAWLRKGSPIAIPTETVYGLAADLFQDAAVEAIFRVKGRPSDNPLIAHISDLSQLESVVEAFSPSFLRLAELFWPGPLTMIVRKKEGVARAASANLLTLGVRMPSHLCARQIISAFGRPLAAPSANLSGKPSPTLFLDVLEDLDEKICCAVDGGACSYGIESTVVSLVGDVPALLRPGVISKAVLEDALGVSLIYPNSSDVPQSPGQKYRHYAPKAKIHLAQSEEEMKKLLFLGAYVPRQLTEQCLYAELRRADRLGYQDIAIYLDPVLRSNEALMNRLEKAR